MVTTNEVTIRTYAFLALSCLTGEESSAAVASYNSGQTFAEACISAFYGFSLQKYLEDEGYTSVSETPDYADLIVEIANVLGQEPPRPLEFDLDDYLEVRGYTDAFVAVRADTKPFLQNMARVLLKVRDLQPQGGDYLPMLESMVDKLTEEGRERVLEYLVDLE